MRKVKKLMLENNMYMYIYGRWWFSHYLVSNSFDPMDTVGPLSHQAPLSMGFSRHE